MKFPISMLSNLAETLHSSAKSKNKQVAEIRSIYLKKQRFGDTMQFPEGLENTPFTIFGQIFDNAKGSFKLLLDGHILPMSIE